MEFRMNGATASVATQGKSVGDVLSTLDEQAEAMGDIIVEVRLDGRVITVDELTGLSERNASEAGIVELEAEPAAAMKERALVTLIEAAGQAGTVLAGGNADAVAEAMTAWNDFASTWSGVFSADEASFIEAFGASPSAKGAEGLIAFFGERLSELRDPVAAMLDAATFFDTIREDLSEVPVRLQTGKDAQAMKTMILAVELVNKMVRIMPLLNRTGLAAGLTVEGATMAEFYGALNDVLRELAGAFENKDGVLIGDLAEYEIRPRLESFFGAVRSAGNDAVTGGAS